MAVLAGSLARPWPARAASPFRLHYVLASAMYGTAPLSNILPEVHKVGASHIDIWPAPHGNQREQIDAMGIDAFGSLLEEHNVKLGVLSSYRSGPFGLKSEMVLAQKLGAEDVVLVCASRGPHDLAGPALREAVRQFVEQMKPHADAAAQAQCTVAIENHSHALIHTPDSMNWFAEFTTAMPSLGLAFAPHHLEQDAAIQAKLINELGPAVKFFYAQQHGKGSRTKMSKEDELLQMPGRGPLDFCPLVAALRETGYKGLSEIFMHPYPRGLPVLETTGRITAEINRSRAYLQQCLQDR